MNEVSTQRAVEICRLHNDIGSMMQKSLENAIRLGELLTLQKEELAHGQFIIWVEAYLPFDQRTAQRYMRLFAYREEIKSDSVSYLQEAYNRVEQLEYKARQEKQKTQQALIQEYERTGEKPEGWDRSAEYELKKKEAFGEKKRTAQEKQDGIIHEGVIDSEIEDLLNQTDRLIEREKKHSHLRLNTFADNLSQGSVFEALEIYINSFEELSQQLEATHNLIKKLKLIANELQKNTAIIT